MEDFRILYEFCKDIGMVSIEKKPEVVKRQQFHRPCSTLELLEVDIFDFVDDYESDGKLSIFWLDYTDLTYRNLIASKFY